MVRGGAGVSDFEYQGHAQGGTRMVSPLHPTSAGPGVHLCQSVRQPRYRGSVTDPTGKSSGVRIISNIVLRRAGWVMGDTVVNGEALNGTMGSFLCHFRAGSSLCHWKKEKALFSSIMNEGKFIFC